MTFNKYLKEVKKRSISLGEYELDIHIKLITLISEISKIIDISKNNLVYNKEFSEEIIKAKIGDFLFHLVDIINIQYVNYSNINTNNFTIPLPKGVSDNGIIYNYFTREIVLEDSMKILTIIIDLYNKKEKDYVNYEKFVVEIMSLLHTLGYDKKLSLCSHDLQTIAEKTLIK